MKERRKAIRFKIGLDVKYNASKGIIGIGSKTISKNISALGIRIPINKLIKKGAKLTMNIKLPGEPKPVVAHGRVVWVKKIGNNPYGDLDAGIRFTSIDKKQRDKLIKIIEGEGKGEIEV